MTWSRLQQYTSRLIAYARALKHIHSLPKYWRLILFAIITGLVLLAVGGVFAREKLFDTAAQSSIPALTKSSENKGSNTPVSLGEDLSITIDGLLKETNKARATQDRAALTLHAKLNASALAKCKDMAQKDYWQHNTPDGAEPWVFITDAGYTYEAAGENLAYGYRTSQETIQGWMDSPSHRENMVNKQYTEVGFGICDSPNYQRQGQQTIVVQHFATPKNISVSPQPAAQASPRTTTTRSAYVPPKCTKVTIPFKTVYEEVSWLEPGETYESSGFNGYKETCTADSTGYTPAPYYVEPYDKTIYVGADIDTAVQ